jgi:hypothetical protein
LTCTLIVAAFGASTPALTVIIGVVFAPGIARIIRAAVLVEMGKKYVTSARLLQGGGLVEEGPASDVLLAPRHPCTRALIAALPGLSAARRPAPRAVAVREHAAVVRIQDQDDPERRRLPPAPPGLLSAGAGEPLVTVAHLTKRYHRQTALRDVSFTIGRGEVLGLVGESGSGKSTLGLALAGLTCYEGTISFAGPAAREGTDPRRGRGRTPHVQVIFQNADASLNPRRTVRRVLARSVELLGGTQAVPGPPDPGGTGAPCRDLPADAVGVRARPEISDGCHLRPTGLPHGTSSTSTFSPAVSARRCCSPAPPRSTRASMSGCSPT